MSIKRVLIASAIMLVTMGMSHYVGHVEQITSNRSLSTFPRDIGRWAGEEDWFDQNTYAVLGVDDSFLCNYYASDGGSVQLYVGFYQSQREGDLIHSPKNCLPGSGWNIVHTSKEEILIPGNTPAAVKATKLTVQQGAQRQIVLYWFQSRGRFIASEYTQKIYLIFDSITRHRTDGSFVRLIAPIDEDKEDWALEYLKDFAGLLIPILKEYIPS